MAHFERCAIIFNWPRIHWPSLSRTQLSGKAVQVFVQIGENEAADYDKLMRRLVTAYESVPAVYRDKFRALQKNAPKLFKILHLFWNTFPSLDKFIRSKFF